MKGKKAQTGTVILSGIIAVIVGVAMLPIFTSLIDSAQSIIAIGNESVTNTVFNESVALSNDDLVVGSYAVINSTTSNPAENISTLRDGTEYTLNKYTGIIKFNNRTGTWDVSYSYEPDTYVDSAMGRTVIKNVTLMYAVALILITCAACGVIWYKQ